MEGSFVSSATATKGHKVGLKYKISKNFATGMAHYTAQEYNGTNIDKLEMELELKAKF